MNAKTEGWANLDALIAKKGEQWVIDEVTLKIENGEDPREIALGFGMPLSVLKSWVSDRADRIKDWELAEICFADGLAYEALREVRDCGLEEVPLARLRSEHYDKKAGKLNRVKWGEQKQVVALEGLTMDQALGGFASMLLEKMRVVETVPMQANESTTESEKEVVENLAATQKNSRMYPVVVDMEV